MKKISNPRYEVGDILQDTYYTKEFVPYNRHLMILKIDKKLECYLTLCLETGSTKKEIWTYYDSYAGIIKVA